MPPAAPERDKHHRFPGAIISHGGWLDSRFPWSERDVPELLCERGIAGTPAASRQWSLTCGPDAAHQRKRRRAQLGDQWPREEVLRTMPW
jgi:transposase-like protein